MNTLVVEWQLHTSWDGCFWETIAWGGTPSDPSSIATASWRLDTTN